jgi:hypothetical protein
MAALSSLALMGNDPESALWLYSEPALKVMSSLELVRDLNSGPLTPYRAMLKMSQVRQKYSDFYAYEGYNVVYKEYYIRKPYFYMIESFIYYLKSACQTVPNL